MSSLDPLVLIISLLPVALLGGLLIYRFRISRRMAQLTRQNKDVLDQTSQHWQESAARTEKMISLHKAAMDQAETRWQEAAVRTEKMIALLTEIRDRATPIAPDPSNLPAGNS